MTRRTAVYLRISDPKGDTADRFGLAVQERTCREYAERNGLTVQRVYTDAITGVTETRQGFGQLLADAAAYTDVVIYAVDRLARHPRAGYALLETLQAAGLQVHTAIEGMLDLEDDAGALNFGVRIVMADAERRRIVRRLSEGKRSKVRAGKPLRPLNGYGYQRGEVYEPHAQWVRWIYTQALSLGTQEIREELRRLGVPSPGGAAGWDRDSIRKLLTNSVYRGEYVYGRDRVTRRPLADAVSCPAPRIVSDETWYAVQRALQYRSTGAGRRGSRTDVYPLTGRLRCAQCGAAMVGGKGSESKRTGVEYRYYKCGDRALAVHTRKGCTHRSLYRTTELHEVVWEALQNLAREPGTLAQALTRPAPVTVDTTAAVRDLDNQLAKARNAYLRGIDSEDEYAETKAMLTAQRARLLALAEQGQPQGVADTEHVQRALTDALRQDDLHVAALRLGLLVRVEPGGGVRLTLDPG
ncbi:recombinase family protein [Deinococcus apachensis]|uniref:recombinase family protein n=1 Tax=Deinococcus apachensis TaxID=309886 RepID=UPI0003627E7D|nr:recombinase family protein [Deinococcus apachensis]